MTTYLLNSPVLTDYGLWKFRPLSVAQAKAYVADGYVSAVGHEGAAQLLSAVLDVPVTVVRTRASMRHGDRAVVLRLLERLPEGTVLDASTLQQMPWEFALLERVG